MYNFAYVSSIPSWANEKKQHVSINRSVWGANFIGAGKELPLYSPKRQPNPNPDRFFILFVFFLMFLFIFIVILFELGFFSRFFF